jgi:uncharacterized lipoprotein
MKYLFVVLILCGCLSKQEQKELLDLQTYIRGTHGFVMNLHVGDKFPSQAKTYLLSESSTSTRYALKDPVPMNKTGIVQYYRTFVYTVKNDTIDSIYVQYPD